MSQPVPSGRATFPSLGKAQETIIVGAGIAGLACARRLHDAGRRFLVISENVGGRIQRSRDGAVNLGAYYVRADYTHVNRYVHLGRRIDRLVLPDGVEFSSVRDDRRHRTQLFELVHAAYCPGLRS